jgi:hypothetical protein
MRTSLLTSKKKVPGIIVGAKIPAALLAVIDEEAERTGLSRSDIMRRALLDAFRHKMPTAMNR